MKNNFMISIDLDLICSSKVHKSLCDNLNLKFILFYFILLYFILLSHPRASFGFLLSRTLYDIHGI